MISLKYYSDLLIIIEYPIKLKIGFPDTLFDLITYWLEYWCAFSQ